ncbi:methyltransferase [Kitasatospora sp. NPDC098663]|uniref:methyltransferase n=1 Tax=Kitasatospora sp. NPDC098663 TaxID=3364096 RepID=UPI0037F59234
MGTTDVDVHHTDGGRPLPTIVSAAGFVGEMPGQVKDMVGQVKDVVGGDDPRAVIWEVIRGQWRFSALYAFVELDLARWLSERPMGVSELAGLCALDEGALARLLRTNATLGVVRSVPDGKGGSRYALTEAGRTLDAGDERSMRSVVIPQGAPDFMDAMGALADAVRTGKSPFGAKFGSFYAYLDSHPEARQHFDAHMVTRSRAIAEAVVARYDFAGIGSFADIGGGAGTILATVLHANAELHGVLFELPSVVAGAQAFLAAELVIDRCEVVAGDFFKAVPTADAYLLSNIVHNWADDTAVTILRNVRSAMPDHGRVLLLDMLLPDDDRPHLGKELDMRMLALHQGGRERTEAEYFGLLREADLTVRRVVELPFALSLIEAVPA